MTFRSAHASADDWQVAVDECVAKLGPVPSGDTLGFVYVTEGLAAPLGLIVETLRARTGVKNWAGAVGMGIAGDEADYFEEPAIAVMVAEVPSAHYKLLASPEAIQSAARERPADPTGFAGPPLLLLHADSGQSDMIDKIDSVAEASGGYLIGGLTMSRSPRHQVAGVVTDSGLSGVLFEPEVRLLTSLSQGCAPVGPVHEVTRAMGNYLFELDGRPALDVLKEDVGEVLARDLRRTAGFIHAAIPVVGSDTGDYVVRNLMGVSEEQGIVAIAEAVEGGDHVMFVSRDPNGARQDFKSMLTKLAERAHGKAKGALFISCIARGPHMFGARGAELQLIRDALGPVPLVGMYANGEISNNRLYGYTGVLTLFV